MYKHILKNKILLTLLVVVMVVSVISQDAYAWGGRGRGGGGRYYWHGGRWYNNGWFWFGAGLTALTIGAIAASLPPNYSTIYAGGVPYYYYDGIYYRPCPSGYVVVPAPIATAPAVVVAAPPVIQQAVYMPAESASVAQPAAPADQGETFTVNVPNYRGSDTTVTLTRSGTGFIGPQGEYYQEFPKIKQLKEMYGK
jgi:hypothetical protein